jgi:pilus assembly protein Flp/PilA
MNVHLFFHMLLRDESGVTAIEYALMGMLVAMMIVATVVTLGQNVKALYDMVASKVQDATGI